MDNKELIEKLNNISLTSLKDKVEIIEKLIKEEKIDFVFIEQINNSLNNIMLKWWKSPKYEK